MADAERFEINDLHWTGGEKVLARKAFNLALQREFDAVIQEAKKKAATIKQPTDLWKLEDYLTKSREYIDRTYDYRYSVLPRVFGVLMRIGRLNEDELAGLADDKLDYIRRVAAG
jgi:photoprotection regulator FRP-like protein